MVVTLMLRQKAEAAEVEAAIAIVYLHIAEKLLQLKMVLRILVQYT